MENLLSMIPNILEVASNASKAILDVYRSSDFQVKIKSDSSPVTRADLAANKIVVNALKKLTPLIPVLSEEGVHSIYSERKKWDTFWLVDPLDGTKEFIKRTGEFTVNIALVKNHQPVLGVVAVPVKDEYYWGVKNHKAFWKEKNETEFREITTQCNKNKPVRITVSRHHGDQTKLKEFLNSLGNYEIITCGSTLKICLIARGEADIYPRFGPTSEWDTAAGQCILEAAGGSITDLSGAKLQYNFKESLKNPKFIAFSCKEILPNNFFVG